MDAQELISLLMKEAFEDKKIIIETEEQFLKIEDVEIEKDIIIIRVKEVGGK